MSPWRNMLRHQYNWMLADCFDDPPGRAEHDWWETNRCPVNACPLVASIAELREQPNYLLQPEAVIAQSLRRW
ncbi:hypothetical protein [Thermostichus vulcanus]|uniref:Uncharacterized protein n=1 Tax=Thermostichus vulcanus str. 'Rupite' TaxID=2813851 RepID=A0ABT0CBB6_THEVL|nr:hypothetical protein [Thermostichus vulcanus]MCJ2542650.1 hypothetical protein [Thermostichus vulcanus str. 'Rupite']